MKEPSKRGVELQNGRKMAEYKTGNNTKRLNAKGNNGDVYKQHVPRSGQGGKQEVLHPWREYTNIYRKKYSLTEWKSNPLTGQTTYK